jgi:hypothetical protein
MSSQDTGHSARVAPAHARTVAGRLAALFDRDRQLAERLAAAHRRLRAANDRLGPGPAVDLLWPDRAAPVADSALAAAPAVHHTTNQTAVAVASGQLHWEIHGAFWDYQQVSEQRRQLAFEVGELTQQLTDALTGAGWSADDARTADVYQLARQERGR